MKASSDTRRQDPGPSLQWAITTVIVMALVYPLALWLRDADIGGGAARSPSAMEVALQNSVEAYQSGRYQDAIDAARKALALNPKLAEAYNNIAVSYLQLGRYDAGIEAAQEALRLQPEFELARHNLAWLKQAKAIASTSGEADRLMQEGLDLLYAQKNPAAAAERFRQVLALNPGHYGANYQLAAALQRAGRVDEARPQWLKALAMARAIKDEKTEALILPYLKPAESDADPNR